MSTARLVLLRSKLTNFNERAKLISSNLNERIKLPEKFKGTIVERWATYWKSLMNDYASVGQDIIKTVKEKPIRTTFMGLSALSAYACVANNPDEMSLIDEIRKSTADMLLVHESCHRKESAEYLKLLERSMNDGTLRTMNLGVVTLVWLHDFNKDLCTYRAICKYTQPEIATFHHRIIDVGFWNRWWNLQKKMLDYDIPDA